MAEMRELRKAYCNKLQELARKDKRVVVLEADLMGASGTKPFFQEFGARGIDVGVAEANMVGVASGLCLEGFIPFAATFGTFASRRAFDQFFISSNYAKLNVKLVGTDPGVSAAFNGGTHMPFEDIGMMRMIPDLVIAEPSDAVSAAAFTELFYKHEGSCYLRLHRKEMPVIYKDDEKFEIGKGKVLKEGNDVTLVGLGAIMMNEVLKAADMLASEGISAAVIDALSVKPLDKELIRKAINKTGVMVTCEDGQVAGGLAAEISDLIVDEQLSCKLGKIGITDRFGQVGTQDFLVKEYNLSAQDIVKKAKSLLRK